MHTRLSGRDFALVLAVVAVWGFAFVVMRWALESVPPFALAGLRFLCAAVPAVFFIRRPAVGWGTLIAYGLAIGAFQFGLLFLGMKLGMPAGLSSLVIQTQAFFTIGLAAWWLHDPLTRHSLIGAGIAAAGIGVLAWQQLGTGAAATFAGFMLVIASALSWSIGNIIAKRAGEKHRNAGPPQGAISAPSGGSAAAPAASVGVHPRTAGPPQGAISAPSGGSAAGVEGPNPTREEFDMLGLVVWASLAAPLPLALASWMFEGGPAAWTAVTGMTWLPWACVLFMSYGATLFGLARWNALLHRYPTTVIAPFSLLIPVFGLGSGAIFLGEGLAPLQFAGVALVLAGLAWNVYGTRARAWLLRSMD